MPMRTERVVGLPLTEDVEAAVDEVLRFAEGDPREALRAVILGQRSVMETYAAAVFIGYVRGGRP